LAEVATLHPTTYSLTGETSMTKYFISYLQRDYDQGRWAWIPHMKITSIHPLQWLKEFNDAVTQKITIAGTSFDHKRAYRRIVSWHQLDDRVALQFQDEME
jgi:hypothetical protein